MKKALSLVGILLLVGCSSESESHLQPKQPSHVEIYKSYLKSPLYQVCQEFEDEIKGAKTSKNSQTLPISTKDGINVLSVTKTESSFEYMLSCEITATYQWGAFYYYDELYEKEIGLISISRKN